MDVEGPRGVLPGEVPAVVELANTIFGRGRFDMGASFPTLFCSDNGPWLRTFWHGNLAVSLIGVWRGLVWTQGRSLTVAHVGAVCTRPEYRARGLASTLLVDALRRLRSEGVALVLISGSRSLYRRMGARPFGRLLRFRVEREALEALRLPAPLLVEGTEPLRRIYDAEPLRYQRSAQEWRVLLPAKGYTGDRGPLLTPDAYVLVGDLDGAVLPVDEFAGARPGVLAVLAAALARSGAQAATVLVQPDDAEMVALLTAAGLPWEPVGHQGIIRVLDGRTCAAALGLTAPAWPGEIGEEAEADAAAQWTQWLLSDGGLQLPRNDGMQYI